MLVNLIGTSANASSISCLKLSTDAQHGFAHLLANASYTRLTALCLRLGLILMSACRRQAAFPQCSKCPPLFMILVWAATHLLPPVACLMLPQQSQTLAGRIPYSKEHKPGLSSVSKRAVSSVSMTRVIWSQ